MSKSMVATDPAHRVVSLKRRKPLPQFLREAELDLLLDKARWEDTYIGVRARTIILCFYSTGIRLAELIGLDDVDVDYVNSQLKVTGKGDKQRVIPFGRELYDALQAYQQVRDHDVERHTQALFVTAAGQRMNRGQVRYEVEKRLSQVSTLKKRSPHVLRHTFATAMLNNGAGLKSVKDLLGHANLKTTEIYTHATYEQLKKVYHRAHPRA